MPSVRPLRTSSSVWEGFRRVLAAECGQVFRRHRLGRLVASLLPNETFNFTRTAVLRLFGWRLGPNVLFSSTPQLLGVGALHERLLVESGVFVNVGAVWDLADEITIGKNVHIGPGVSLLTASHEVGGSSCRAGDLVHSPINVGAGVWIGAGAIVLAGSSIGAGSVIASGCVVRGDVPPNCLFGGVPGRVIRVYAVEEQTNTL